MVSKTVSTTSQLLRKCQKTADAARQTDELPSAGIKGHRHPEIAQWACEAYGGNRAGTKKMTEMNKVSIDFCISCGRWIAASTGTMRTGQTGEVEIICNECLVLEQHEACLIGHDKKSGTL